MGASEEEKAAIRAEIRTVARLESQLRIRGVTFDVYRLRHHDLIVFSTGMSIANAAATTQLAVDRFRLDAILMAGIAGSVSATYRPGDVVVPVEWSYHDESVYLNPKSDGPGYVAKYGFSPTYQNFSFMFPRDVAVGRDDTATPVRLPAFPADRTLLDFARTASLQHSRPGWQLTVLGHGVSGSVFVDNRDYRTYLRTVWRAEVVDMESAAVAQTSWLNHIPFVIARGVSDLAGEQDGRNASDANGANAATHAAAAIREIAIRLDAAVPR
jgi:adenosylhomocysteine nucleosidase